MQLISGKYNTAKVFTDTLDAKSQEQIQTLCNQEFVIGSKIRLMPDVHAGAGCTIGTTMTITDKVVPNLVGVDIGCGMETVMLKNTVIIDLIELDKLIYKQIPSSTNIRRTEHEFVDQVPLSQLNWRGFDINRAKFSIGTLGGGNHFIEVNKGNEGELYIVIHSGSRHLGKELAEYYQNQAVKQTKGVSVPKPLAYLTSDLFTAYLQDMKITQLYADVNRKAMMQIIINGLGITKNDIHEQFTTIHNYIDTESMILRKGAVSARVGEKLLIPINMRDGSLVCEGLGNPDWNFSAPHGAGRLMSRKKAFEILNLDDFKKSMQGIYSTSIHKNTLDESPMCYKDKEEIMNNIIPTAKVIKVIKSIYNFKAGE